MTKFSKNSIFLRLPPPNCKFFSNELLISETNTNPFYIIFDNGTEPYYYNTSVNLSPDVKLYTLAGQEVTTPQFGVTYNVKVTIHNKSGQSAYFDLSNLSVHWLAKNVTPEWNGSWTSAGQLCGHARSGVITFGSSTINIGANGSVTLTRQWSFPLISNCMVSPYTTPLHLVAVMDDGCLTIGKDATQMPLEQFVRTNNNVAWHQYTLTYDNVVPAITSVSPNPTGGQVEVSYTLGGSVRGAVLAVATATGERVATVPLTADEGSVTVDLQTVRSGQYIVQLLSTTEVLDAKPLVVER